MEQLIKALTRAANAVAAYYEMEAGNPVKAAQRVDFSGGEVKVDEVNAELKKTRKARTPKAEVAAPQIEKPQAAVPSAAAPTGPMTEAESEAKLKVVGEAFVQRFSKQEDAVTEVKRTIEEKFKVARLRDLKHEQRVVLIATLEARIREIDSRPTAGVGPAPTGLGL